MLTNLNDHNSLETHYTCDSELHGFLKNAFWYSTSNTNDYDRESQRRTLLKNLYCVNKILKVYYDFSSVLL